MILRNGNKGFTLIELLVVLSLIGLVVSIYATLYYSGYKTYSDVVNSSDVEQNVRYAMTYIMNKVNQCSDKSKITPYNINGYTGIKIDDKNIILYNSQLHKLFDYLNNGNEIATNIYGFFVTPSQDGTIINVKIVGQKSDGTGKITLTSDIYLRK
ncbi:prepilin-type N-terminal cleavage/methylation domain-containing protein [Thermoanaerobacterium saccharolyticum]|uniref:PilW family protein n=1 Tax=Thermoanaerobacterium saccharolyticum TaxID=28896 RepID=UPI000AC5281A